MRDAAQLELATDDEACTATSAEEMHALAVVRLRKDVMPALASATSCVSKEIGDLFDARPSHVADAIAFRTINGSVRAFDVEWLVALLLAAPEHEKLKILTTLCNVAGYKSPERRSKLTPEQENAARKRAEKKYLPAAMLELIDREIEES